MSKYPSHIQYILDHYGAKFQGALNANNVHINISKALRTFMLADPTEGKHLTD